ncbi:adenylate kinase [Pseudomonas sp. PDM32]|uniref:adenylate kinase n=1 Tax=Pseudomonas sp. PDM32 TaxID=2854768 RepID=UPI001C47DEA7|nr:adenylate kinase [Pseudomonas sp. PDM32]MBV7573506.1 adenylate kinase [Pseudomonas sp. PDM32]
MNLTRTLIIGNSGSGKSWLAQRLAQQLREPWTDLDRIHWLSDEHSIPRPRAEALAIARIATDEQRWVIEGVYGWIISEILHRATALIWLSIGDKECVANIHQRETQDDERLVAMLEWAGSYRTRDDSSGFAAHQRLFDGFCGEKIRLADRKEIAALIHHL